MPAGRHRWVVFGDLDWPSGQESSTVPPEWHGESLLHVYNTVRSLLYVGTTSLVTTLLVQVGYIVLQTLRQPRYALLLHVCLCPHQRADETLAWMLREEQSLSHVMAIYRRMCHIQYIMFHTTQIRLGRHRHMLPREHGRIRAKDHGKRWESGLFRVLGHTEFCQFGDGLHIYASVLMDNVTSSCI